MEQTDGVASGAFVGTGAGLVYIVLTYKSIFPIPTRSKSLLLDSHFMTTSHFCHFGISNVTVWTGFPDRLRLVIRENVCPFCPLPYFALMLETTNAFVRYTRAPNSTTEWSMTAYTFKFCCYRHLFAIVLALFLIVYKSKQST